MFFVILFIPKDDFALLESRLHIDDALIGGTAETQGNILEGLDVSSVYQNVNERKHLIGGLTSWIAALAPQLTVQGKSRKAPNGLIGTFLAKAMQERNQRGLIFGFERLSAKQRQSVDVIRLAGCDNLILDLACEGLPKGEIPRLGLKALLTVIGAARYKQNRAYPFPICDVVFL